MTDVPEKRSKIANEILSTEDTFVKHLKDVIEGYIAPLKSSSMIPTASISSIFSNLEMLYKLHSEFLNDLKARISSWSETTKLGDVFISMAPYFKMHNQYCMNYENATQVLQREIKSNPAFAKFIAESQHSERFSGTYITTMLIMPIQIIPRYELLINQMIKYTNESHADFEQLRISLGKMHEINEFVNESCIKADKIQRMTALSLELGMEQLLTPTRKMIGEYEMEISTKTWTGPSKFYLFNDLVILKTRKSTKHKPYIASPIVVTFIRAATEKSCQLVTRSRTVGINFANEDAYNNWKKVYEDQLQKQLEETPALKLERSSVVIIETDGRFVAASSKDRKKLKTRPGASTLPRQHAVSLTHAAPNMDRKISASTSLLSSSGVLFTEAADLSDAEDGEDSTDDESEM